jgi:hypothetical protein
VAYRNLLLKLVLLLLNTPASRKYYDGVMPALLTLGIPRHRFPHPLSRPPHWLPELPISMAP